MFLHSQCAKDKIEWHIQVHIKTQLYESGTTDRAKKEVYKRRDTSGLYRINMDQETQVELAALQWISV